MEEEEPGRGPAHPDAPPLHGPGPAPGPAPPWPLQPCWKQLSFLPVLPRFCKLPYKIFPARMSLESLFQHIIFTEHQAEESHRALREGQGPDPGRDGGETLVLGGKKGGVFATPREGKS